MLPNIKEMTYIDCWDKLVEIELFTEKELQLVTCINGHTIETLNDCVYVRTGYRTVKDFLETIEEEC